MKIKKLVSIFIGILILLIIAVLFSTYESGLFKGINSETIKTFILSFGLLGPIIATLLISIQTMTMVIPDILTVFASSALYGWFYTVLIALVGSLIGATGCFFVGRLLGRDFIVKISNQKTIIKIDSFFDKYGSYSILFARLIPFIPFDITSYLAGVTSINYLKFILATGIGELPMTILYAYLGKLLSKNDEYFFIVFSIIIVIFIAILIFKKFYKKKDIS